MEKTGPYVYGKSRTRLSDFTFPFHFHALEKEMATHSSVLARRIPGTGEPGGLPSMGSHRVRQDWSDLAAAAAAAAVILFSHEKEGNPVICGNMDGPCAFYTKRNKPDRERKDISLICGI